MVTMWLLLAGTIMKDDHLVEFAKSGVICEFDLFGIENSFYELSDVFEMPSDAVRINRLKMLIDEGFGKRIVIAHDIHTKHRLVNFKRLSLISAHFSMFQMKYSGHGFSHIHLNVLPKMKMRGFTEQNINDIMVNNPRQWLTL